MFFVDLVPRTLIFAVFFHNNAKRFWAKRKKIYSTGERGLQWCRCKRQNAIFTLFFFLFPEKLIFHVWDQRLLRNTPFNSIGGNHNFFSTNKYGDETKIFCWRKKQKVKKIFDPFAKIAVVHIQGWFTRKVFKCWIFFPPVCFRGTSVKNALLETQKRFVEATQKTKEVCT